MTTPSAQPAGPGTEDPRRYAHDVAPMPHGEIAEEGAALATFRAHAARAQALWLATTGHDHGSNGTWAISPMLAEWRLAQAWAALADIGHGITHDVDVLAAAIADVSRAPHCIGPDIWQLCTDAGLNPALIRPYREQDVVAGGGR